MRGIGNDLKQSTPVVCGLKSSPVYTDEYIFIVINLI